MTNIRPAAVAGTFYEANPDMLIRSLEQCFEAAKRAPTIDNLRAIIAPHAGYIFSGPIAASAYQLLMHSSFARVLLLGPAHRVPITGVATSSADYFRTPLGDIPLDRDALLALEESENVITSDLAHALEHSLEVHLPFLQYTLKSFQLIPLIVGDISAQELGNIVAPYMNDKQTLIVISSDLSHYLSYERAKDIDLQTAKAIEDMNYEAIDFDQACGRLPISGLLHEAKKSHWHIQRLDLRNSGDTAGDRSRVVGYGAWAASESVLQ